MTRKSLKASVINLTQPLGLVVRRVHAPAASHELSLIEAAVMARLDRDGRQPLLN